MKTIIDSNGTVVNVPENQSIIRFIPIHIREQELQNFSSDFIAMTRQDENNKGFCYLIQPFHCREKLVFFSKTEFSSSSQAVKISQEINKYPEILANKGKKEFLQSIFSTEEKGKISWYFLTVGSVELERNMYDCKKINVSYIEPVPYATFINELKEVTITEKELDKCKPCLKYKVIDNGVDLNNGKSLVEKAFKRDIVDGIYSEFDNDVFKEINRYKNIKYSLKDEKSNEATNILMIINNKENIFPVYVELKNFIKKNFKNSSVRYKNKEIIVGFNGIHSYSFYVSGVNKPKYIINGNIIDDTAEIKNLILENTIPEEPSWYSEKVKPNIIIQKDIRKPKVKEKDLIDWKKQIKKRGKNNGTNSKTRRNFSNKC